MRDSIVARALGAVARGVRDTATLRARERQGALPRQGRRAHRLLKGLGKLPAEERREAGAASTPPSSRSRQALEARRAALAQTAARRAARRAGARRHAARARPRPRRLHPVIRTWQRIEEIWRSIGFEVADGPEIETDWYNFTALNSRKTTRRARCRTRSMSTDGGLPAAHAYQPDAGALCAHAQAADQGDRAGPHLPRRFRRDPFADVPPGRRPVDRRAHQLRRPEGRVHRVPAPLLRERRRWRCASGRRSFRSPSPRPRST